MPTPHINAKDNDFSDVVLMPGDTLRARYIAENYLSDARLVSDVRNMLAYTGYYQDKKASVMGSGMGIPSIVLYASELYRHFNVEKIIRIGSCGSVQPQIKLQDLILAQGASTDSSVCQQYMPNQHFAAIGDFSLLEQAVSHARELKIPHHTGNVFSADLFYDPDPGKTATLTQSGILAVEMEAAGLYTLAAHYQKKALAICTVSDHLLTGEAMDSKDRESSLNQMIQVALQLN